MLLLTYTPKRRIKVMQCSLGHSIYFYRHGSNRWDTAQIALHDIVRHGSLQAYYDYLRSINCNYLADQVQALINP